VLTREEAVQIRACGLAARAGRWRCPLLPDCLVRHLSLLWMLSDQYGPETRGQQLCLSSSAKSARDISVRHATAVRRANVSCLPCATF